MGKRNPESSPSGQRVAILGAARTPIGKFGGSLRSVPAVSLGAVALKAALERSGVAPDAVRQVVFGHCIQAGAGQNPARQVLRAAGIPDTSGAATVNMVCGSGMQAIIFGAAQIRAGDFGVVAVGGMESMSMAPFLIPSAARWGLRYGARTVDDSMLRDSLLDAYAEHEHMGLTGERIARKYGLTRAEVDAFALRSHLAASRGTREGVFTKEIVPVPQSLVAQGPGLDRDEGPRPDTTLEGLARLKPSFLPNGLLTAGNSSQLADGAAALILAGEAEASRSRVPPLAWIHSSYVSGVPPPRVMESPIPTVRAHFKQTGFQPSDFDRVEHNEAFSSASIAVQRALGFTDGQFNVNGGAVALGHPIGASGARIVVTLAYELLRSQGSRGLATLCMGGGNGLSLILERSTH